MSSFLGKVQFEYWTDIYEVYFTSDITRHMGGGVFFRQAYSAPDKKENNTNAHKNKTT